MIFNIDALVRENVKKLNPYRSARDDFKNFDKQMIFLDANENPFDNGVNRYPDPQQQLLKAILAEQKGVKATQILLGNGSDEVLDLIYRTFCEPRQDNIITLPPTYGMYKVLSEINDVENRAVLLTKNYQPDVEKIIKTIDTNTKLIFVCSPNNPTGNLFNVQSIEKLLKSFNGIVVIDEAYIDFSSQLSWLERLSVFDNLIVIQTLSKAYGMAGIRLGICYASEEIIAVLNKIKPPYNVSALTQKKALLKLSDWESVKNKISLILEEKHKLYKVLLEVEFIKKIYPTDANFILVRVDDANKRYIELLEKAIVIRDRSTQPLCENTLRFTVGTPLENKKLIQVLKEL